jgi:hypothetical protein
MMRWHKVLFNTQKGLFDKQKVLSNKQNVLFNKQKVLFNKQKVLASRTLPSKAPTCRPGSAPKKQTRSGEPRFAVYQVVNFRKVFRLT